MNRGLAAALLAGAAWLSACASTPPEEPASRSTAAPRPANCNAAVRVVNNSPRPVLRVFIKDPALTGWGRDRLVQNVLAPSGNVSIPTDGPGRFDVRIAWADGSTQEIRRVDICATPTVTISNFGLTAR